MPATAISFWSRSIISRLTVCARYMMRVEREIIPCCLRWFNAHSRDGCLTPRSSDKAPFLEIPHSYEPYVIFYPVMQFTCLLVSDTHYVGRRRENKQKPWNFFRQYMLDESKRCSKHNLVKARTKYSCKNLLIQLQGFQEQILKSKIYSCWTVDFINNTAIPQNFFM